MSNETGQDVWFGRDVRLTRVTWVGNYAEFDPSRGAPFFFEKSIDSAFPGIGDSLKFAIGIYPDDWNPRIPVHAKPIREVAVEASYELLPEFSKPIYRFEALIPQPFVVPYSPTVTPYLAIVDTDPDTHMPFFWQGTSLDGSHRLSVRYRDTDNWDTFGGAGGLAFTLYGEVIPEPSVFALGGLAFLAFAPLRRRK